MFATFLMKSTFLRESSTALREGFAVCPWGEILWVLLIQVRCDTTATDGSVIGDPALKTLRCMWREVGEFFSVKAERDSRGREQPRCNKRRKSNRIKGQIEQSDRRAKEKSCLAWTRESEQAKLLKRSIAEGRAGSSEEKGANGFG